MSLSKVRLDVTMPCKSSGGLACGEARPTPRPRLICLLAGHDILALFNARVGSISLIHPQQCIFFQYCCQINFEIRILYYHKRFFTVTQGKVINNLKHLKINLCLIMYAIVCIVCM